MDEEQIQHPGATKKWWTSKTLWVNTIAFVAFIAQEATGHVVISVEAQAVILSGINLLLRVITKTGLEM